MAQNSLVRTLAKPLLAILGPAAVMTAGVMGAGSTTSLVLAGAYFGYSLLWIVVITLPVLVVAQDSASRIGILSGNKGTFTIISQEIHPLLKWFFFPPILILGFIANMGQTKVMVHAVLTIAGVDEPDLSLIVAATFVVVIGSLLSVLFGSYKHVERIMTGLLFVMAIAFLAVAVRGFSEPMELAAGLVPNIPPNAGTRDSMQFIAAIAAGAIAITALLSFPYFSAEAGYTEKDIPMAFRKAVLTFGVIFGVWSVAALVAGASVLHKLPNALEIQDANQAGRVLGPILGGWSVILFSLGLFSAAYSTFITVAQLQTYFVLDAFGKDWRFAAENKGFRWVFAILLLLPGLSSPLWQFPALLAIVAAMVLGILGTPAALALVIYLINKNSLMKEYRASFVRNVVLAFGLLLSFWIAYRNIQQFLR